jgi:hypothetical protein
MVPEKLVPFPDLEQQSQNLIEKVGMKLRFAF